MTDYYSNMNLSVNINVEDGRAVAVIEDERAWLSIVKWKLNGGGDIAFKLKLKPPS